MEMGEYTREHLKLPFTTIVVTLGAVITFSDLPPEKTTLVLSASVIVISIGLIYIKYLSFKKHERPKDALFVNICMAQIVACLVAIISVYLHGFFEIKFANLLYFSVLAVALIITGNMSLFGGGSLFVIMLSSAALYWIPILKTWLE